MKKIESKAVRERKQKRNQLIVGSVLVGLMIFSSLAYAFSSRTDTNYEEIEFNELKFERNSGYWIFNLNGKQYTTLYNPLEIKNVSFKSNLRLLDYSGQTLYVVGMSGEPLNEILRNIGSDLVRINPACIDGLNCTGDFPVKKCSEDYIIIIENSDANVIRQEDKCVYIKGDYENQLRMADAFLFKILGIN